VILLCKRGIILDRINFLKINHFLSPSNFPPIISHGWRTFLVLISRAYKVELDPNNKQCTALRQHCGAARHVWNWGLSEKKRLYKETGKSPSAIDLHRKLNLLKKVPKDQGGKPWLYEASKCAGQESLRDLDKAFKNFFRRCKQKNVRRKGFPKFKSRRKGLGTCRFTGSIRASETHVQLPRLGKIRLKERGYLPTPENENVRVLSATVSEKAGRWFVSFAVKEEVTNPIPKVKAKPVGIDVGISSLATCSDGTVYENPRALRRNLQRLRRFQRSLSRKKKGSQNRRKAIRRVQRLHYRVSCLRSDSLHKATSEIVQRYDLLGIETLNVFGMLKNRKLSRALSDTSMSEFLRQIRYKAEWKGAEVFEAPRFYPSSKTCSSCGQVKQGLALKDRVFRCDFCGLVIGRDLNAAINLKELARSSRVTACGEESSGHGHWAMTKLSSMKQEPNTRTTHLSNFG
jgi:putative transposase